MSAAIVEPVNMGALRRRPMANESDPSSTNMAKKSRTDEDAKRAKLDKYVNYLKDNVLAITACADNIVYHGGSISIQDAEKANFEKANFEKGNCTWFAFDLGHCIDYAQKQETLNPALCSFRLKRSIKLLDLRPTVYEPTKKYGDSTNSGDDEEEEEEDSYAHANSEDEDEEAFMGHFAEPHLRAIKAFHCAYDTDFADKMRSVVLARELGFDGFLSLDYGMFTELILFDASDKILEHQKTYALDTPVPSGHLYAQDSLLAENFESIDPEELEEGDVVNHYDDCVRWNYKCKATPISEEQRDFLVVQVNEMIERLRGY